MHEIFHEQWPCGILPTNVRLVNQLEPDELCFYYLLYLFVIFIVLHTGREHTDGLAVHASYGIVHFLLPWRKTSIHRDSAGEVGVVVGIFSTHVQKQNVAIAAHFAVSNVMKHAGVRPGGDDGLICKSARPFPKEFMHILGLNLILLNTRLNKFQHTSE